MSAPLYHSYDPVTQRATEVTKEPDGTTLFIHSQNTRPIVESAKAIAASFDPTVQRDTVHVARIPNVIWRELQRTGVAHDQKRLNAWLNERDNAVFRTDNRSKL